MTPNVGQKAAGSTGDDIQDVIETLEIRLKSAKRAVQDIQDVVDEASRHAGTPDLVGSFRISSPLSGPGRDAVLQRDLYPCEGGGEFTADIKDAFARGMLTDAGTKRIRRHALEQSRGMLRQRLMKDHGEPAWSFEAHIVMNEIIRQSGLDVDLFAIADAQNWDKFRCVVEGGTLSFPWGRAEIEVFQIGAGYITPTMKITTGHREIRMGLNQENPWILLDEAYPETMIQSIVGRTLMEAVPHPLFEGLQDIEITRTASGETSTIINFRTITAGLAEAPGDVDVSWMRLPAHIG